MSASVGFNCLFCAGRDACKHRPDSNYITVSRKTGWCFVSQKMVDKLDKYKFRGKIVGKVKKVVEEKPDGNV